jgi:predicted TIM-barrel fold metal-dependent hydrolase
MDEMYQDYPEDLYYTDRQFGSEDYYLEKMPSEYIRDNFFFTTQPIELPKNKKHASSLLEMGNATDTYLFATDWPHHTADTVDWVFENRAIDDDLRAEILHENAREAYNFDG